MPARQKSERLGATSPSCAERRGAAAAEAGLPGSGRTRAARAAILTGVLVAACGTGPSSPSAVGSCGPFPPWPSSEYVLPYPVGTAYLVLQGNCSGLSHTGVYQYGYDFDMSIGTPITAARAGEVVVRRFGFDDTQIRDGQQNYVMVRHADGMITGYSHLTNRVVVSVGDTVAAGDPVGFSGNTGTSSGIPHLHFSMSSCLVPNDCGTRPLTFRNTDPNPNGLEAGRVYPARAY